MARGTLAVHGSGRACLRTWMRGRGRGWNMAWGGVVNVDVAGVVVVVVVSDGQRGGG